MNFYKGSNADHFDQMLKEISQVTYIQDKNSSYEHIMTDETYETPKIALVNLMKKKVKMTTFWFSDSITYILRSSMKGDEI